ncbi:flavin-dependent monooxygenase [Arenibaculum sp.]|uniref:flavin-dependent monooxygenase n=1 Tax=Arenibaculum sp. TaxID=2865862 RepID=UPI002E0E3C56|nr:flavin-dependent monooxygenase [Arenibaculum sp.]
MTATAQDIDPDTLLARARAMVPALADLAPAGDRERRLPDAAVALMREAGFFRILQPRRYGGWEMAPAVFNEVQATLAKADMSAGWVHGVVGVLAFHLALLDDRAQAEVWGDDPSTLIASSYMPRGRAVPVEGGYRLSGRWGFASGVDHCGWAFLGGIVEGDGSGPPDARAFLVPRADLRVLDTWRVTGLKGTGSHDVVVEDAFVPEYRTHRNADRFHGRNPGTAVNTGPLYRVPLPQLLFRAISSSSIGALRHLLDAFVEYNGPRVSVMGTAVARDPVAQLACAEAAAGIDEMTALLRRNFDRLMDHARRGGQAPIRDRQVYRLHATMVPERCCALAQRLFKASGASALSEDRPFGRVLADLAAARQHAAVQFELHGRALGAAMLGVGGEDTLL